VPKSSHVSRSAFRAQEGVHDILERKTTGSNQDVTWHLHCTVWLFMTSSMSKSVLIGVIWATALGIADRAYAQSGSALAPTDFTIYFEAYDGQQWVKMNSVQQQYFFNRARCQCDQDTSAEFKVVIQPAAGTAQKITALLAGGLTGGQGVGRLFAGALGVDCLAPGGSFGGNLAPYCTNLLDPDNYPGFSFAMSIFENANFWVSPPIPVAYLFNSQSNPTCGSQGTCDLASTCSTTATQTNIQFWAQTNSGTGADFDPGPQAMVSLVGNVPYAPILGAVEGGNEALTVSWSWPSGQNPAADATLLGVQLFCQRGAGDQVFSTGSNSAAYVTPAMLCPASTTTPTTGGPFANFDPKYLCSGLIPSTATSYRIVGLQNGIPYGVAVAAVDKYGNIGALSDVFYAMPDAATGGTDRSVGGPVTGPRTSFGSGCAIAGGRKHDRGEAAGILWLAVATLALVFRSARSRQSRRPA
jgi:hypothetical protein